MLDPRLYRIALVPVLVAVLVAAFSLENRPRPLATTLAPDAFSGPRAERTLNDLAAAFPRRAAGEVGDDRLAERVADDLRRVLDGGTVELHRDAADTSEGERELVEVVATRPGRPGPGLVVVAHRDARGSPARAQLSGTAGLLELARVTGEGRVRRTITFVSTSGGTVGAGGAVAAARRLSGQPVDAVLVLGDLAGERIRKPFVVGFSNGPGQASLRLRRTVEAAVRLEAGTEPGGYRALTQWSRLAVPLTTGEQGAFLEEGLPAVLLSVSGERGPGDSDRVDADRLETFGRAALRAITALDAGPDVGPATQEAVVTARKVLPAWAVRLLVGALLLPPLLLVVDGWARLRRRREPVGGWVAWVLLAAVPFVLTGLFALFLAVTGLLPGAPPEPPEPGALAVDGTASGVLLALVLVLALGWLGVRPLLVRAFAAGGRPDGEGAAMAVLLVGIAAAVLIWAVNPHAGMLLVPAVHMWLLVLPPGMRLRGPVGAVLALLGAAPLILVWVVHGVSLGLGGLETAWLGVLLVAGGHVSFVTWLLWSVVAGCAISAVLVAARRPPETVGPPSEVTVRGPVTYAGPGSLGGTESALRR